MHRTPGGRRLFWWLIFLAPLLPLATLLAAGFRQELGGDPAQTIVTFLGIWALRLLLITLAVTPCRRLLGWNWLQRYRRLLGLYTLFYASLHLLAFATFILGWRAGLIVQALSERPYIIVGFVAWLGLAGAGDHLYPRLDQAFGTALAAAALPGLSHCPAGAAALCLADPGRVWRGAGLCPGAGCAAGIQGQRPLAASGEALREAHQLSPELAQSRQSLWGGQ